jgi:putative ABC transport system permease protein
MPIPYSLTTLWHERQRFLPAVLVVAFSAVLMALQSGLLFGLFSITSIPIDNVDAEIWVGSAGTVSIDQAEPIPEHYLTRLASQPEVKRCEIYLKGLASWAKADGGSELCMVIGSRLDAASLGAVRQLNPEQWAWLSEPGAVIVDRAELARLGIRGIRHSAEVNGTRVRVVGCVAGLQSLAAPYVFCSLETARQLLRLPPEQVTYLLGCCHHPAQAQVVAERLLVYPTLTAVTRAELSWRTRLHWMVKTRAGIALGCAAALGLLVGGIVTSQTLYAAVAGSLREYAVLRALGIPRWRMVTAVLAQSFWVGLAGIGLAVPAVFGLAKGAGLLGAKVLLPPGLLGLAGAVTMAMALLSGLAALRALRLVEPATLLR